MDPIAIIFIVAVVAVVGYKVFGKKDKTVDNNTSNGGKNAGKPGNKEK